MFARWIAAARERLAHAGRAHWRWGVVAVVLLLVVWLPNVPGRWNTDTAVMIEQMQADRYDDVWSPFITWLWKPLFDLGLGAAWLMAAQVVVLAFAVGVILRRLGVSPRLAPWLTVALCVSPVFYASAISVMRDTWFLCALLVAVACALSPPTRGWVALFVTSVVLAVASRQNAVPAIAVVVAWAAWRWSPWTQMRRRGFAAAAAALMLPVGVVLALSAWESVVGVDQEHPETALFVGDLDELSGRAGVVLFPASVVDPPFTLDELRASSIYSLEPLWFGDRRASLRQTDAVHADIARAWREAVLDHPVAYLHGRWRLFTRQVGWSGAPTIAYFPADIGTVRSPHPRFPEAAEAASDYLSVFARDGDWRWGGWMHRAWVWWVVAMAVATWQWMAHRRRAFAVLALAITVHLAALFFVAPHGQFRFVECAIELAQLSLVAAAAVAWQRRDQRVASTR